MFYSVLSGLSGCCFLKTTSHYSAAESGTPPALPRASAFPFTNSRTDGTVTVLSETVVMVSFSADLQSLSQRRSFATWKTQTDCRRAVHHMPITRASIPCHNGRIWHLAVVVSMTLPAGRPPTLPTATTIGGVGGRPRQLARTNFNVVACCLLFFYKIDIGDLRMSMF